MSDSYVTILGRHHVAWTCQTCGVLATTPRDLYEYRRGEGGYNFCPNGHQWGWDGTNCERENLRRERDRLKQKLAQKDDEIAHERRRVAAQFGENTKLRKRVGNGVCPCCTRSFTNLRAHMRTKHPDFKTPTELKVVA